METGRPVAGAQRQRRIQRWKGEAMPIQIGAQTHSFSEPTKLLSDCHRRIEMFLKVLQAAAEHCERPLTQDERTSIATALRYFREAAPKHTADEEESLFPRLRQMDHAEMQFELGRLKTLEEDHRRAAPLHARVEKLGHHYLEIGPLPASQAEELRASLATLTAMYRQHIDVEDSVVFPLASQLLSPEQKKSVGQEMAARRGQHE